jgi:hypothetical protein
MATNGMLSPAHSCHGLWSLWTSPFKSEAALAVEGALVTAAAAAFCRQPQLCLAVDCIPLLSAPASREAGGQQGGGLSGLVDWQKQAHGQQPAPQRTAHCMQQSIKLAGGHECMGDCSSLPRCLGVCSPGAACNAVHSPAHLRPGAVSVPKMSSLLPATLPCSLKSYGRHADQ